MERYGVVAERFRSRSIFLFSLSDVEFFKNSFVMFPYGLPAPETSRQQLIRMSSGKNLAVRFPSSSFYRPLLRKKKRKAETDTSREPHGFRY
jgi:hypothetical protein